MANMSLYTAYEPFLSIVYIHLFIFTLLAAIIDYEEIKLRLLPLLVAIWQGWKKN